MLKSGQWLRAMLPMSSSKHPQLAYYLLAVLLVAGAVMLRLIVVQQFGERPLFIIYMLPITLSALLGGLGPGLCATLLIVALVQWQIVVASGGVAAAHYDQIQLAILALNGLLVCVLSEALKYSRQQETLKRQAYVDAQQQLLQSDTLFQTVFEQAAVGMAQLTLQGYWLKVNRKLSAILGYTPAELLQCQIQDLCYAADLAQNQALWAALLAGEVDSQSAVQRFVHKNGQLLCLNLTLSLARNSAATPVYCIAVLEDIAARVANEAALQRFSTIFQFAGWGMLIADAQSNIMTHVNPAFARMHGFEVDEMSGMPLAEIFSPEERPNIGQHVQQAETHGYYTYESMHVRKDGTRFPCLTKVTSFIDPHGGQCIFRAATCEDISARKHLEAEAQAVQASVLQEQQEARLAALNLLEDSLAAKTRAEQINSALQKSEQRLLLAQEGAHVGIWEWDKVHNQWYFSPECTRILGFTADVLNAVTDWHSLVNPEDFPLFTTQWETHILQGKPFELEFRWQAPQGEMLWLFCKGSAVYATDNQPQKLSGIILDISARKQTEQQIRKLAQALEQSPVSVIITDLAGYIEYVNSAFVRNTGYGYAEIIGQQPKILHSGKTPSATYEALWRTLLQGKIWNGEFVNKRKDGTEYVCLSTVLPIHESDGRICNYVAIEEDITEKKRLSLELDQHRFHLERLVESRTAELEEARKAADFANRAKSEFLANMSHEIRSPMNAVLGLCYLLEQRTLESEALELVRKIHQAGYSLLGIINDILDFSKIEAGRLEIEVAPFNLNDLLEHLAGLMSTAAMGKNLELIINPPPEALGLLLGDGVRLQQILVNLLSNAIKFTEQGEVELALHIKQQHDQGVYLRFVVRDTGIGISSAQQAVIFSAFTQADSSITRRFGGSGLGLTISQQLVNLMGGQLQVNSCVGQGSEFYFELPFTQAVSAVPPTANMLRLNVLLADNNAATRQALENVITSLQWMPDVMPQQRSAVLTRVLTRQQLGTPYDALLLNWSPPAQDAVSLAQSLQQCLLAQGQTAHKTYIILLVAANQRDEVLAQSGMSSVDALLSKPITPANLLRTLTDMVNAQPAHTQTPAARNLTHQRIAGVRVLVVDDSEINREVAQRILMDAGAIVSLAADGQEAIDWLSANPDEVDIVLMDVQMPRMDGYTATREIRKHPRWQTLPIVALTAGAFKTLENAAREAGMDDFVTKPFDVEQLLTLIQALVLPHTAPATLATAPPVPAELPVAALPYLDVPTGVQRWQTQANYARYLEKFLDSYSQSGTQLQAALEHGEQQTLQMLAHKMKGVAGNLALDALTAQLTQLEQRWHEGERLDSLVELQHTLAQTCAAITQWITAQQAPLQTSLLKPNSLAGSELRALLMQTLAALDEDNPLYVDPLLPRLAENLQAQTYADIVAQVQEFDFRAAENSIKAVLAQLD